MEALKILEKPGKPFLHSLERVLKMLHLWHRAHLLPVIARNGGQAPMR